MLKLITNFHEFFEEESGELSNVRLNSTLCVGAAIYLSLATTPVDLGALVVLLGAGFGPKVFQKIIEKKSSPQENGHAPIP